MGGDVLAAKLAQVRYRQGRLIGRMQALGFRLRDEAFLHTLTDGAMPWRRYTLDGFVKLREAVFEAMPFGAFF